MKLTGINIKGFKSFARETDIYFNEKVTGIIGPNGSGKSNIVDAIRWVLGEQKPTELRLDNMPDVIFNGTSKVKKASMAQVSLYFENSKNILSSDYNNIAISRTLYAGGESEYRLNDLVCRLKDIRDLFIDTGIGPDSYAIIALNMVEDLLSDTNDARRIMFEQAAGISKFKKRKKETLNQLSNTKNDLERINDLVYEIENNLKDLEKQARRARQYIALKNNYKELSVSLFTRQYFDIINKLKDIDFQIKNELDDHQKIETEIAKNESILQEFRSKILIKDKDLSDEQRKANQLLDELRKNENLKQIISQKLVFNTQKIEESTKEKDKLNINIQEFEKKSVAISSRIVDENEKLKILTDAYERLNNANAELRKQYNTQKILADSLTSHLKKLDENKFGFLKNIAIHNNKVEGSHKEIELKEKRLEDLKSKISDNALIEKEMTQKSEELQVKLNHLNFLIEGQKIRKEKLKSAMTGLQKDLDQNERLHDSKSNELKLLQSMIENMEGFPESIKFVHKIASGKIPLVSDLITIDDKYKIALENFLEPYLNYFVVEDKQQALDSINQLRQSNKGKVSFFVLNRISIPDTTDYRIPDLNPILNFAKFNDNYESLFKYLLGNVYVSDLEDLSHEVAHDIVVINNSGSIISRPDSLSGGSIGLFDGKTIGRKQNVEQLSEFINTIKKKSQKIAKEINSIENEISLIDLQKNEQELKSLEIQSNNIRIEYLKHNSLNENLRSSTDELQMEIDRNKNIIYESSNEIIKIQNQISEIEKEVSDLSNSDTGRDGNIEELLADLTESGSKVNQANIDTLKQKNLIDVLAKDNEFYNLQLTELKQQDTDLEKLKVNLNIQIKEDTQKLEILEKELVSQYVLKSTSESIISELEKNYFENRNKVSELENISSELRNQLNKSQFLINQLKEKQLDLEFKSQSVRERVRIEFNVMIDDQTVDPLEETNFEEIAEKVDKMRIKVENFGDVNTLAIEAHDEMQKRLDNILTQREDILEAEKSLKKTISEIETTATQLFLSAFDSIRRHFKIVFASLFTEGDTCDLELESPDIPLDSRINIIAKPKGKRPKSINQLSGGEKTLTAIALLFSMYLFKPAPFCIFDEVDAPLDDANISKFNNIIRDFSDNSQFIIVTHNKSTMTAVDVLYGIYMQEPGISEVAPVDFREIPNS